MIDSWIVVRSERHVDDRYWVCLALKDALLIAKTVTAYWVEANGMKDQDIDQELYEDQIYRFDVDDGFRVLVYPQKIRQVGESNLDENDR